MKKSVLAIFCIYSTSIFSQAKKDSIKTQQIQAVTLNKKIIQQVGDKTYFNVENSPISKGNNGLEVLQKSPKLSVNADGKILLHNKLGIILTIKISRNGFI